MKKRKLPFLFGRALWGELPLGVRGGYRVELDAGQKGGRVLVSGAEHIVKYTDDAIVFLIGGRSLTVSGTSLVCITYEGGTAEVEGEILGIFVANKEGCV